MISTFNEWHEDSQIEPTSGTAGTTNQDDSSTGYEYTQGDYYTDYGHLYLDILRQETAQKAHGPNPLDQATDVCINSKLIWVAGFGAESHDVYFGTSFDDVNDADRNSPQYKGNQTTTIYDPGIMQANTTYYWRIDEIYDGTNVVKGEVWSFTTGYSVLLLSDGFEENFDKWATNWDRTTSQRHHGIYSARCDDNDDDLISDNLDTSGYSSITIEFWYRDDDIDDSDNVYFQLYDGSNYDNKFELGNTTPEDVWHKYETTIYNSGSDAQYFHSTFRIKFEGSSIDWFENLWIDDVRITAE